MKEKSARTLTPRLRFPEFNGPWEYTEIAPFLEPYTDRISAPTELPIYTSSREGLTPQENYYSGRTVKNDSDYGVVPPDHFVFRHMSDDGLFRFNLNETGNDIAVSKEYPVFRAVNLNRYFLLSKLNDSPDFRSFAQSQKAGGTRTRLYFSKLRTWRSLLPSPPEQQKIADCLGSLDTLIAAEGRKLAALRDHKRGLMQQLFPQPGETQPRLRFSHQGDWAAVGLPEVAFFQEGPGIMAVDFRTEGVPLVRLSGVGGPVVTLDGCNRLDPVKVAQKWSHFRLSVNDIIISTSATFGLSSLVTDATAGAVFYTGLIRFRPSDERIDRGYLKIFLESPYFERQAKSVAVGGGIKHFGPTHLKHMQIPTPPLDEQQRIADCLSSLDTQITAQAAKIDALKQHKRGLMQQLFPTPETS